MKIVINKFISIGLSEDEMDLPIYRIYPLQRFFGILKNRADVVANPTLHWDDPFENFFLSRTRFFDDVTSAYIPLTNLAKDWYGQCWSLNPESDAMWRIYNPKRGHTAVKVKTTCAKLINNLMGVNDFATQLQFLIGKVEYQTQSQIISYMSDITFSDVVSGGQSKGMASLLCIKREAFAHEAEVRILYQDIGKADLKDIGPGLRQFPLDPNVVFDEVVLDPRKKNISKLQSALIKAGCSLPISRSSLYEIPDFTIQL